ncbi:hypothetical protein GCM10009539_61360 [Cryptosporangium japonicum]|uniref:Uncharacterized protein n=1 Tax=Cryptosporangium japonicum TaxID=80872 RepID=A0ABP3ELV3_9ACTN
MGPAAAGWSSIYGVLGLAWSAGAPGFPFGHEHDRYGETISVLDPVTRSGAAPVVAVLGLFGALVAGALTRVATRAAIAVAWVYAVGLTFVLPDYRPLIRVAYTPMLLIGEVGFAEMYPWPVLNQMLCIGGGLLWAGTAVVATRRRRSSCTSCGRADAAEGTDGRLAAARWGRVATYVAVGVPLIYCLTRWAWALGIPLGVSREFLRAGEADTPGIWLIGAMLGTLGAGGAVLTLGLIQRWGEIYPRWIPGLRGKTVRPRTAIVPATLVAIMVTTAGLMYVRITVLGQLPGEFRENVATVGPELFWPLWGIALGAATYAYHLRRRPACRVCGRS